MIPDRSNAPLSRAVPSVPSGRVPQQIQKSQECYCSDECKWNARAFRGVRSLLKALSDAEALKVLRDS